MKLNKEKASKYPNTYKKTIERKLNKASIRLKNATTVQDLLFYNELVEDLDKALKEIDEIKSDVS